MKTTLRGRPSLDIDLTRILKAVATMLTAAAWELPCSDDYVHARLKQAAIEHAIDGFRGCLPCSMKWSHGACWHRKSLPLITTGATGAVTTKIRTTSTATKAVERTPVWFRQDTPLVEPPVGHGSPW